MVGSKREDRSKAYVVELILVVNDPGIAPGHLRAGQTEQRVRQIHAGACRKRVVRG